MVVYLDRTDSDNDWINYYLLYFDSIWCVESLNKYGLDIDRIQQENSIAQ